MKRPVIAVAAMMILVPGLTAAQQVRDNVDSAVVARIKEEGLKNSQVMDLLVYLCDVYGPRLSWSPEYRRGADWVSAKLKEWGLQNITYDRWAPTGRGWTLKNFSAMVTAPTAFPVIAYPAAWSPGFKEKEAEVVYVEANKVEDLEKYKGKLKGKFVLVSDPLELKPHFEVEATRLTDSVLLRMANADIQGGRRGRRPPSQRMNLQNIDSIRLVLGRELDD